MLTSFGIEARVAAGADDALRLLATESFDLALIDRWMPGADGLEIGRRIHGEPATRGLPLVLLNTPAPKGREERARPRSAEFASVVGKPLRARTLAEGIRAALARVPAPEAVLAPAPREEPPCDDGTEPSRILLAEDNRINQKVALKLLERLG